MVTLIEIIAILGFVTGLPSLAILIYKTWRERPNLTFTIENCSWYLHHPDATFTIISVSLRMDNNGERNTTIHTANMFFEQNGKRHNGEKLSTLNTTVRANETTSKIFDFHFPLKDIVITNDITNSTVILYYTHGTKSIKIPLIKKS
jgi:hypothetical protein